MIMKPYGLNELREMFLRFFETKGHLRLPSFSLIPQDDASLLLPEVHPHRRYREHRQDRAPRHVF